MAIFWIIQFYLFVFHGFFFCFFSFFEMKQLSSMPSDFFFDLKFIITKLVHTVDDKKSKKMK